MDSPLSKKFSARLHKQRIPSGGPQYCLAGLAPEEIRHFLDQHGLVPPLAERELARLCQQGHRI